ncbi:MAG TPA: hypothetical protein VGQ12_11160 [Candidatus Angelobacter sp.]|jgi:hypothetical protein|nr:hypothetical protein [Candidatus Angelobacter sp.]
MTSSDENVFEERYLVRYLTGALPAEEAERLDQLSIANDDFAWRLREIENDLVDAYVRSQLSGETLNQFKSYYMASPNRRQKVQFAEGLRQLQATNATASKTADKSSKSRALFWGTFPLRIAPQFGISLAALVMLLVAGFLIRDNAHLRRDVRNTRAQYESTNQHARDLENELKQQSTAITEAKKKLEGLDQPKADAGELKTVSLLLPPPTRGISSIKRITLHPDTDLVVLLLTLESADFPYYSVTVKDQVTNEVVWKSSQLDVGSASERKIVSAGLRAHLLKERNYIAEVAGLANAGRQRVVGDYPFHVVLR